MKEIIRRILWPFSLLEIEWVFKAREGTLWFRFMAWLYGEDEAFSADPWTVQYPDKEEQP
jgi:hypothetical protein